MYVVNAYCKRSDFQDGYGPFFSILGNTNSAHHFNIWLIYQRLRINLITMIKIIDSRLKLKKVCPWAITQRQNTSTDLIDTRRRRISSLQSLSLTGIRSTCVTFLDTHQKENFILIQLKMKIIFFHMFMALNAYNTFTDEEKEIERLFGKLMNFIKWKPSLYHFKWSIWYIHQQLQNWRFLDLVDFLWIFTRHHFLMINELFSNP